MARKSFAVRGFAVSEKILEIKRKGRCLENFQSFYSAVDWIVSPVL